MSEFLLPSGFKDELFEQASLEHHRNDDRRKPGAPAGVDTGCALNVIDRGPD